MRLITLRGALNGNLGRPAQFMQQARDVVLLVAHSKLAPNDLVDAGAVPELTTKAVSFGPVGEVVGQEIFLLSGQFRRRARTRSGTQPFRADFGDTRHPLANCALCDTQCFGDFFVGPAVAFEFERSPTTLLFPIRLGMLLFHAHVLSIDFRFSY